ncbi:MAG: PDZ domain-containing protein [Alphaproteobacteria bacterium]|nr:PDZ domain-containing protein [Alphaproteobacteria bacterium]
MPPLALLTLACVTSVRPLSADLSDAPSPEAMREAIHQLEQAYAFTAWKGLDWAELEARLAPPLEADPGALDAALRELVLAIPDGHVLLENEDPARELCPEAEGALGLRFSDTDEDGVIVVSVTSGSPADAAGIALGDRLLRWDGLPVEDALEAQPLQCYPVGLATLARRRAGRVRLLSRAEVGVEVPLELEREGARLERALVAEADGALFRELLELLPPAERITSRMLSDEVGYLRIGWEATATSDRQARAALRDLWREGARALVLDLRDNDGGTDQTAANIVGVFTDEAWFYETITMYDRREGGQVPISEVWVEPQELRWDLPTAVLINGDTVSSGEGMAMMLRRFEGVELVGFEGTAASFGSSGSTLDFAGGWSLTWPAGRSLDARGEIQLDSDAGLEGGVQPTHRIPWTAEHRLAFAADPEGFEIDYALALLEAR